MTLKWFNYLFVCLTTTAKLTTPKKKQYLHRLWLNLYFNHWCWAQNHFFSSIYNHLNWMQDSRWDVGLGVLLHQLSFRVHCEDPVQRHSDFFIGKHILKNVQTRVKKVLHLGVFMQAFNFQANKNSWVGLIWPSAVLFITCGYRWSVSKRCVERLLVGVEEVLDIIETLHLEFLWLLLDHLPVEHKQTRHRDNDG